MTLLRVYVKGSGFLNGENVPYTVKYKPLKRSKRDWAIMSEKGRIVGRSTSKKKAEASVRARLVGEYGWRSK